MQSLSRVNPFTFQSGYIQISVLSNIIFNYCYFTFQSGYIQINIPCSIFPFPYSLHSNLVIFKLITITTIFSIVLLYIPIWLYSNLASSDGLIRP